MFILILDLIPKSISYSKLKLTILHFTMKMNLMCITILNITYLLTKTAIYWNNKAGALILLKLTKFNPKETILQTYIASWYM